MYCQKCGSEVSVGSASCGKCGNLISQSASIGNNPSLVFPSSTLRRLSNYVIDCIVANVIFVTFITFTSGSVISSGPSISYIFISIFYLAIYYIFCESIWGRTVGKLITGTKVVDRDGNKPSFLKILGRSFARYIPFEWISFLFGGFPVGWHDSLSKTYVVSNSLSVEDVKKIDIQQVKKQASNNSAVVVVVILIAVLFFIAIIGILSSVVLASLNAARIKGQDAVVRSSLDFIKPSAEIYFDLQTPNSYGVATNCLTGMFNDPSISNYISEIETFKRRLDCHSSGKSYSVSSTLSSGSYCVDSSGYRGSGTAVFGKDGVSRCENTVTQSDI